MSGLTGFSLAVRRLAKERAGVEGNFTRCERCGVWSEVVQCHHRRPRKAGGDKRPETNGAANLGVVCPADHMWLEENRAAAMRLGWIVRSWDDPSKVAIELWNGTWFLCDDGSVVPAPQTSEAS